MRLFIAINFEDNIKDKIKEIIEEVESYSIQGKFVNEDHLHLTMEFLGEIEPNRIDDIKAAMNKVTSKPFNISLTDLGYFKRKEGDICWLGIDYNEMLLETQIELHSMLVVKEFELEKREYKPHLTIGRKVKIREDFDSDVLSSKIKDITINVDRLDLMKSENIKGTLKYTIIYSKQL